MNTLWIEDRCKERQPLFWHCVAIAGTTEADQKKGAEFMAVTMTSRLGTESVSKKEAIDFSP